MTSSMPLMSSPRAATSVATSTLKRPLLKPASVASRAAWAMSPCSALQQQQQQHRGMHTRHMQAWRQEGSVSLVHGIKPSPCTCRSCAWCIQRCMPHVTQKAVPPLCRICEHVCQYASTCMHKPVFNLECCSSLLGMLHTACPTQ
jgi:hypothetical protein